MIKEKRNTLILVSSFLAVCLIVTSIFVISKTLSQNQKQGNSSSIPNNILQDEYVYTGITKQPLNKRLYQHNYGDKGKGFDVLERQYGDLTRNQARAIEQYFIENGPNSMNKINSIKPNSKYYADAMEWAKKFLGVG